MNRLTWLRVTFTVGVFALFLSVGTADPVWLRLLGATAAVGPPWMPTLFAELEAIDDA